MTKYAEPKSKNTSTEGMKPGNRTQDNQKNSHKLNNLRTGIKSLKVDGNEK